MVRTKSVDRSCESQNLENKNSKNEFKSKTRSATQPNKNNSKKADQLSKKTANNSNKKTDNNSNKKTSKNLIKKIANNSTKISSTELSTSSTQKQTKTTKMSNFPLEQAPLKKKNSEQLLKEKLSVCLLLYFKCENLLCN